MQQLLLDITPDSAQVLSRFVTTGNEEAWHAVNQLALHELREPLIYLWGPTGCGKSHLLKAAVSQTLQHDQPARYLDATCPEQPADGLLAIDNVSRLDEMAQIRLFGLINAAREGHGRLLVAGSSVPTQLPLRPDVTSRLGWHLVYQLQPLSDEAKQLALRERASQLGFELSVPIIHYLMTHWRRDLPSLIWLLEQLDHHSLVRQRPITLPLLREVLQTHQQEQPDSVINPRDGGANA